MNSTFLISLCLAALCSATPSLPQTPAAGVSKSNEAPAQLDLPDRVGENGVSAPVALVTSKPKFPKKARKQRINGDVLIDLVVEADGVPSHVQVLRGVGYGLDEAALDAVKAYRFSPALKNGVPVRVEINVQVPVHIF